MSIEFRKVIYRNMPHVQICPACELPLEMHEKREIGGVPMTLCAAMPVDKIWFAEPMYSDDPRRMFPIDAEIQL